MWLTLLAVDYKLLFGFFTCDEYFHIDVVRIDALVCGNLTVTELPTIFEVIMNNHTLKIGLFSIRKRLDEILQVL